MSYLHFCILFPGSEEYLEAVKKTPYMTLEDLQVFTLKYGDVYFHPVSPKFAPESSKLSSDYANLNV